MVGVEVKKPGADGWSLASSLAELKQLARTAGAEVVGEMTQKLSEPSVQWYLGKGKVEELKALNGEKRSDVVIFDDELSAVQQRNLEDSLKVKVIDRTALILDIFARRAQTREGKLQVELAQHQYLLPRLAGQWSHLERLGGGIGTRGPGESQLETDRRLIRQHIKRLHEKIEEVRRHRALYRASRKRSGIKVVALVGYTNAGKSTLFNRLSDARVAAENKLFSTLDPTTRRLRLGDDVAASARADRVPQSDQADVSQARRPVPPAAARCTSHTGTEACAAGEVLITDTVGFIQKLPTSIVAAFRATLEELNEADLLLHVVDITHKNAAEQTGTVETILKDLGVAGKPRILVLNKVDMLAAEEAELESLSGKLMSGKDNEDPAAVALISAYRGWGLGDLLLKIAQKLGTA
ncbi:MAG: GTPase HflX [Chloroflexi bacterium]|nr:GTPase HflX [Chloroflexota bacterium]